MNNFELDENESIVYVSNVQVKDIRGSLVRDRTFLIHELSATLQLTNYRLILSPEGSAAKGKALWWWWWDEILEIFLHKQRGFYVMQPECAAIKLRSGDAILFENNDVFFAYENDAVALLEVIWFTAACALIRHSIRMQLPRPRLPRVVNWSPQSDTLTAVFGVLNTVYDVASSAGRHLTHIDNDINQANAPSQQAEITVDTCSAIDFRELPTFLPSAASPATRFCEPHEHSFSSIRSSLVDSSAVQSFFEALPLCLSIGSSNYPRSVLDESLVINDEILHTPPFDESLYCKLVIENHKYSLAELYDERHAASEAKAKRWMKYGILAGIATLNPLMPFFLSNQGRTNADKGTKLEELIPDPYPMFLQDEYSFSRMIHGGVGVPQMRRLIIHPVLNGDHLSYRVLPAALTQNFVIPLQIFSFKNSRFLRPICAGIDPVQPNYNAKRLHKLYYHLRVDGRQEDIGERINVCGVDIDLERYKLYKFTSYSKELEYYYIDYPTEPGHVF